MLMFFIQKNAYYLYVVCWLLNVEEQKWLLIGLRWAAATN